MSNVNESEQVLQIGQTTGREFQITGSALVSLEGIVVTLATGGALTAAITLDAFEGARLLTFQVIGGTPAVGNIVVAGDDIDGNAQTETLAFTMANETMTTANAYVSAGLTATPNTYTGGTANVTGTVSGNWVVQSSRKNADPRIWLNEFDPADALTADIPIAQVQGSPSRIYQITGGNVGVEGWLDKTFEVVYR